MNYSYTKIKHNHTLFSLCNVLCVFQISSPACTELEVVMMDWLAKMIGLPEMFLASAGQGGGGVIQVSFDLIFYISR